MLFIEARAFTMSRRTIARQFKEYFARYVSHRQILSVCRYYDWRVGCRPAEVGMSHLSNGSLMVRVSVDKVYRQYQKVVWEEVIGPVPKGAYLLPINGDYFDFDPFNWLLLDQGMANRLRLAGFFEAPPELKPTIFAAARLKQALQERTGKRFRNLAICK